MLMQYTALKKKHTKRLAKMSKNQDQMAVLNI